MRYQALELENSQPVEVVYASNDYHLFGQELAEIVALNPLMTLHLCEHREDAIHLVEAAAARYANQAYYYVSGKLDVVSSFRKVLHKVYRVVRLFAIGFWDTRYPA